MNKKNIIKKIISLLWIIFSFLFTYFIFKNKEIRYLWNYENIIKFLLIFFVIVFVCPIILLISYKILYFIIIDNLFPFLSDNKKDEKDWNNDKNIKMFSLILSVFSYISILYVVFTRNVFNINELIINQIYLKIPALILVILISFIIIVFFFYTTLFLMINKNKEYFISLIGIISHEIFIIVFSIFEIILKIIFDLVDIIRIIPDYIGNLAGLLSVESTIKNILEEMNKQRGNASDDYKEDNQND